MNASGSPSAYPSTPVRRRQGVAFRHNLTNLAVVLLIGVGFFFFLLLPLSAFIESTIHDDIRRVSQNLHRMCVQAHNELLLNGHSPESPQARIKRAFVLDQIEQFMAEEKLAVIVADHERSLLTPPAWSEAMLTEGVVNLQAAREPISHFSLEGERHYYAGRESFSPWGWRMMVFKETGQYQAVLDRLYQAYLITIGLLALWALISFFTFRRQVEQPIQEIINALERNEKPSYRGVYEFTFLSDRLRATITGMEEETRRNQELNRIILQQQKMESLGIMAGGIAHDFNNLHTAVFGHISLATISLPPDHPAQESLKLAETASVRARDLTTQLLDCAQRSHTPLLKDKVAIDKLIEETARLVLVDSSISFQLTTPPDLWPANIDRAKIGDVFHNLILNAREAMPAGGNIEIACANRKLKGNKRLPLPAGAYLRITVCDNGPGLTPVVAAQVFDPYFSTKERDSRKGSGLGLAICHSVISRHGGQIEVAAKPGQGASFTIFLPADPTALQQAGNDQKAGEGN